MESVGEAIAAREVIGKGRGSTGPDIGVKVMEVSPGVEGAWNGVSLARTDLRDDPVGARHEGEN
jgi:hypothetical protein